MPTLISRHFLFFAKKIQRARIVFRNMSTSLIILVVILVIKVTWLTLGFIGFFLIMRDSKWINQMPWFNTFEIIGSTCSVFVIVFFSILLGPATVMIWYKKIKKAKLNQFMITPYTILITTLATKILWLAFGSFILLLLLLGIVVFITRPRKPKMPN